MTEDDDRKVLLARIRVAACNARLIAADIEEVGALLSSGRITVQGAIYWLWANGVDDLVLADDEMENVA